MASLLFENGTIREVWHPMGELNGQPRFKKANWEVLDWASTSAGSVERYIVPVGFVRFTDADLNDIVSPRTAASDAIDVGQEFGFYSFDRFIIEENESDGKKDSFIALHSFGYL